MKRIEKTCVICGKKYMGTSRQKACDSICAAERRRICAKTYKTGKRQKHKDAMQFRSVKLGKLAQTEKEARAAGLSYGQYTARKEAENGAN